MNEHIRQAEHNNCFLKCISDRYPDHFYDWKVTSLYYVCYHLIQAFADTKGIYIGSTHKDISESFDPRFKTRKFQMPKHIWTCYHRIQSYSRDSRYNGILEHIDANEVHKNNYSDCKEHFKHFKEYMEKHGVSFNEDYDSTQAVA